MNERVEHRPMRVVPDFRGLNFDASSALQRQAEVTPADPNPDAPSIRAYWWEHQHLVVATQDPEPGSWIRQWDSVRIRLIPPEALLGARVGDTPPPTRRAEAELPQDEVKSQ